MTDTFYTIAYFLTTSLALLFLLGLYFQLRKSYIIKKQLKQNNKDKIWIRDNEKSLRQKGLKPFKVAGRIIYAKSYKEAINSHNVEVSKSK